MAHLLATALSFPTVVYTVLLGVALVYWLFVMIGAAHVDLLGEGAADGALDGAADGALDGVAKGALEGAAKGALEGAADGLEGGHDGVDVADGQGHGGAAAGVMASLKLRSAPATVVLSVLLLFSWLLSVLGAQAAEAVLPPSAVTFAKIALLVLCPVVALLPTSIAVRPLARVFAPPRAAANKDLVGQVCTIRTGTVTDRFGEAHLDDGGAGLVVRVRVDTGGDLKRGDQAVIIGYDAEREEFTVAPMENLLDDEAPKKRQGIRGEG